MIKQCADRMHESILSTFPSVSMVRAVLSTDEDLPFIAFRFGYTLEYPVVPDQPMPFHNVMKTMLDWHPNIESYAKTLSRRGRDSRLITYGHMTTWQEMIGNYNAVWICSEHLKVVNAEGRMAQNRGVVAADFDLPEHLAHFTPPDGPGIMVMSVDLEFFHHRKYIRINTNNN